MAGYVQILCRVCFRNTENVWCKCCAQQGCWGYSLGLCFLTTSASFVFSTGLGFQICENNSLLLLWIITTPVFFPGLISVYICIPFFFSSGYASDFQHGERWLSCHEQYLNCMRDQNCQPICEMDINWWVG